MTYENNEQILKLVSTMLSSEVTAVRGAQLANALADELEATLTTKKAVKVAAPVVAAPVVAAPVVAAPVVAAPVVAAPVVAAPVVAAPVVAAPVVAAPVVDMTPEQLNAALVAEFKRLGGRVQIDEVMTNDFKIQSINDLVADQRQPLITAVQALEVKVA